MKMKKIILFFLVLISSDSFSFAQGYAIGSEIKDFSLKNVDGNSVSLSAYKDKKIVVVIFVSNACSYVNSYDSRIISAASKYADKSVSFLLINSSDASQSADESFENMQRIAKEKKYTFPNLQDANQSTALAFGVKKTPHAYLLENVQGKFMLRYSGAIDDSPQVADQAKAHYLTDAIDAILSGKSVSTAETKPAGCMIQWKE